MLELHPHIYIIYLSWNILVCSVRIIKFGLKSKMASAKKIKIDIPEIQPQSENINVCFNKEHPLLNSLILENLFKFCCTTTHRGNKNTLSTLSPLRVVCKTWDSEITKILRPKTQLRLDRLLLPYPDGLGWTWNRRYRTTGTLYYFKCPYPATRPFENIKIKGTCETARNPKVQRFLNISGASIKGIYYTSALSCSHQTKFLGHLLNSRCPNLESLNINGVKCFFSLLYIFEGELKTNRIFNGSLNCAKLKTLTISIQTENLFTGYTPCASVKSQRNLELRKKIIINIIQLILEFTKLVDIPIDQKGNNAFYRLIENDNLPKDFLEETVIPSNMKSFQGHFVDWGLLGHILRGSSLEKLIIDRVDEEEQCRHLFLFLLYQPSKLRTTLKHLELTENVNIHKDSVCLKSISLLKCPLESFKIGYFVPYRSSIKRLQDLLIGCSGTLNSLEIGMYDKIYPLNSLPHPILFPQLPKLQTLKVQCISWLLVEGKQLLDNCPNLKHMSLLDSHQPECIAITMPFFNLRAVTKFCGSFEAQQKLSQYHLKELKINGILNNELIVQLCKKQLNNLVKVDLSVQTANQFYCLLKHMSITWTKLEDIAISLCGSAVNGCADDSSYNGALIEFLPKFNDLKFLDLTFHSNVKVFLALETFQNGFAKARNLIALKVSNFLILEYERRLIRKSLAHIPACTFLMTSNVAEQD